jgi:hypothetical protein
MKAGQMASGTSSAGVDDDLLARLVGPATTGSIGTPTRS